MRVFLVIFLIATLRNTHGERFDDLAYLERSVPLNFMIPKEYSAKYVDVIVSEKTAFKVPYAEKREQIKQFFLGDNYLFFPEGVQGCRKPVLMRKHLSEVFAAIPHRDNSEYDLHSLAFNGYDIRFSYYQVKNCQITKAFRKKGIPIEDVNDLVVTLVFLSEKTSSQFWQKLNSSILDDDDIAAIVDSKKSELLQKLEESKVHPIDSNGLLVQHMLYNRIRLDDVTLLLVILQYLEHHKLKVSEVFYDDKLHKYFEAKGLVSKRRSLGDRVALDKLMEEHGFSYITLAAILIVKTNGTYPHNAEFAKFIRDEINAMSGKTNSRRTTSIVKNRSRDQLMTAEIDGENRVTRRRDHIRSDEDEDEFEESLDEDFDSRDRENLESILKKRKYAEENDYIDM